MNIRTKRVTLLAALVAFGLVAAACGDDDDDGAATTVAAAETTASETTSAPTETTSGGSETTAGATETSAAAPEDADPNGVLRVSQGLIGATLSFDPPTAPPGIHKVLEAIYGNLLVKTEDFEYTPSMATSVEIIDPQTIEVELRERMAFTDGTPVDAEALKFNFERFKANPNIKGLRSEIFGALDQVEVTGPLTATVRLSTPTAGIFYDLFAGPETSLVSPTAIQAGQDMAADPVGAGPFMVQSVEPDVKAVLVKNPDYWNADEVLVAGLEFVHLTAGPPVVNALQTEVVDVATTNFATAQNLTDPIVTETKAHPGLFILNVCKSDPPLSDVRVRQALAFAMDRDVLGERLYGGETQPAWSLRPPGDPYHNPDLEGVYEYNPDRARELLAEAGYPDGFSTSMIVGAGNSTIAGETLQAQWAEIGIDLELMESTAVVVDFYQEGKAPMFPVQQTRAGLDTHTVLLLPGAFANVCDYSNPEIEAVLADGMAAAPDSPEAVEAWQQLSALVAEELPYIPIVYHNEVLAHNENNVGGLAWHLDEFGNRIPNLEGVYIKA